MKKKTLPTGKKRLGKPTTTEADWAEAALQLISEAGLEALTVEALANRLKVTKGSFYWHFKSREDLLSAALQRWENRSTRDSMLALQAVEDPYRRLELLLDATAQPPRTHSLYAALAGAPKHSVVRKVLKRVAAQRIAYLTECYVQAGLRADVAKAHSVLANAAYRGLLQLANEAPGSLANVDWKVYAETLKARLIPRR